MENAFTSFDVTNLEKKEKAIAKLIEKNIFESCSKEYQFESACKLNYFQLLKV